MARTLPIRAYFEFDLHPDSRMVYTFNLDTHRKNSSPSLKKITPYLDMYSPHSVNITVMAATGLSM